MKTSGCSHSSLEEQDTGFPFRWTRSLPSHDGCYHKGMIRVHVSVNLLIFNTVHRAFNTPSSKSASHFTQLLQPGEVTRGYNWRGELFCHKRKHYLCSNPSAISNWLFCYYRGHFLEGLGRCWANCSRGILLVLRDSRVQKTDKCTGASLGLQL